MVDTCGLYQMVKSSDFELITCKLFDKGGTIHTNLRIECLYATKRFYKVDLKWHQKIDDLTQTHFLYKKSPPYSGSFSVLDSKLMVIWSKTLVD